MSIMSIVALQRCNWLYYTEKDNNIVKALSVFRIDIGVLLDVHV